MIAWAIQQAAEQPPVVQAELFTLLILLVASVVLQALLAPKPKIENARPAVLGDFQFPTATQDRHVPILFGTCRQKGPNVVWYGDLDQRPRTVTQKTGLFSSKKQIVGFQYDIGFQSAVCRGSDTTLVTCLTIWVGEDIVFSGTLSGGSTANINAPELFGGDELGQGGLVGTFRWHSGGNTQTVNSYLTGFQSIGGATPRYSGTAYGVWEGGYIGNSTQIKPWSFEVRRLPNGLGLGVASVNGGMDANWMNVAYEYITNTEWGRGEPAANIDTTAFTTAANTLRTEGNGCSWLVESPTDTFLDEICRHIGGVIFEDHQTGKWTVKLARADYSIGSVPQLTSPIKVESYSTGTWEGTTNQVTVTFSNRANLYNVDKATAQDSANALIQGGGTVTTVKPVAGPVSYAGVKDADLAMAIAWRELHEVSLPLTVATVTVDRTFWDLTPYSVIAWTDATRNLNQRAFRVKDIDYGRPGAQEIRLGLVEDIFQFEAGAFGAPPATQFVAPSPSPVAIPSGEQLAFEAPRAIAYRSPDGLQAYFFAAARRTTNATAIEIRKRNPSGSGSYVEFGSIAGFMLIGQLNSSLAEGTAIPTTTITITPNPDTQADLEAAFTDSADTVDVGTNLTSLILVDNEFMLPMSAQTSGANVQLNNVYRGVLDSVQAAHSSAAPVYLVFVGGNVSDGAIPETASVDVKLLPQTAFGTLAEGSATTITFTMDKRTRRPYPPGRLSLGNTAYASTASLEGAGSGAEGVGIDVDFIRRDYRTGNGADEIASLTTDAASLFPDFPTANNTTVEIGVYNTSSGAVLLFTMTGITTTSAIPLRIQILKATDGVIPSTMRLDLIERHDEGPDTGLASRQTLSHGFSVTSALTGRFNFGALDTDEVSNLYTATQAGTYNFTLSSAHAAGNVEYRLNGGVFTLLILATMTTGSIPGVLVSDTIEVRDRSTETGPRQLDMDAPSTGQDAYAITYS